MLHRNSTEKVHVVEEVQEKEMISLAELKSINTLLAASARKYQTSSNSWTAVFDTTRMASQTNLLMQTFLI